MVMKVIVASCDRDSRTRLFMSLKQVNEQKTFTSRENGAVKEFAQSAIDDPLGTVDELDEIVDDIDAFAQMVKKNVDQVYVIDFRSRSQAYDFLEQLLQHWGDVDAVMIRKGEMSAMEEIGRQIFDRCLNDAEKRRFTSTYASSRGSGDI